MLSLKSIGHAILGLYMTAYQENDDDQVVEALTSLVDRVEEVKELVRAGDLAALEESVQMFKAAHVDAEELVKTAKISDELRVAKQLDLERIFSLVEGVIAATNLINEKAKEEEEKISDGRSEVFSSFSIPRSDLKINKSSEAPTRRNESSSSVSGGSASANSKESLFKRKRLPMPEFRGDIREWRRFWASFDSAVHSKDISDSEKVEALEACLLGTAKEVLNGFDLTAENYASIVEELHIQFGNKTRLVNAYYEELGKLVPARTSAEERRNLDAIKKVMVNLRAVKSDTEQEMLKSIIIPKFPKETMRWAFRVLVKTAEMKFSVDELIGVLGILVGIDVLADSYYNQGESSSSSSKPAASKGASGGFLASGLMAGASGCLLCSKGGGRHRTEDCRTYGTYASRKARFAELRLCFMCGAADHSSPNCPLRGRSCTVCNRKGHMNLTCIDHLSKLRQPNKRPANGAGNFLETFSCMLKTPQGDKFRVRGIIDSGSSYSYASNDLVHRLRLKVSNPQSILVGLFGTPDSTMIETGSVQVTLANDDQTVERLFSLMTTPCISGNISTSPPVSVVREVLPSTFMYADPQLFDEHKDSVDILIGSNYQFDIFLGPTKRLDNNVVLRKSIFGWIPSGEIRLPKHNAVPTLLANANLAEQANVPSSVADKATASVKLESENPKSSDFALPGLDQMWSLETLGIKSSEIQNVDDNVLRDFRETYTFQNGRFSVCWPWKVPEKVVDGVPKPRLPTNYRMCVARLRSLVERSSPQLLERYHAQIFEQLEAGIVELAPISTSNATKHYLPHRAVVKEDKIRVVYDGSAKTKGGCSINDLMHKGPCLTEDLVGLLFGFREHSIGLSADIEKAFLQIELNEVDRDAVRFLWVKDPSKPVVPSNMVVYRFARVPFGIIASPFLLNIVLQELLCSPPHNPILLQAKNSFYVDNFLKSVKSTSEALRTYHALTSKLKSASFNLRDWISNDRTFLKAINSPHALNLIDPISVLGLKWNVQDDVLFVKMPSCGSTNNPTKRSILKYYASIFDPLSFFGPVTLPLKLLIQKCWKDKFEWDSSLPSRLVAEWQKFFAECQGIFGLPIPRCYFSMNHPDSLTLHIFCDASVKAYACCAYLSYSDLVNGSSESCLMYAKVRIAPISFENKERAKLKQAKKVQEEAIREAVTKGLPSPEQSVERDTCTIPELELLGVLIGTRVATFIRSKISVCQTVLWTDASTVLQWLNSSKVLPLFVRNRVNEIKSVKDLVIRYVPGKENPADLATRGCSAEVLKSSEIWWKGPVWLTQPDLWPSSPENTEIFESLEPSTHALLVGSSPGFQSVLLPDSLEKKFKSWDSAVNLFKCYNNLRFRHSGVIPSSFEEYRCAEDLLILELQKKYFPKERRMLSEKDGKKKVQPDVNLGLFLQSENSIPHESLIRCGGRLRNASLPWSTIHPILLPRQSPLVRLYIKKLHWKNHHVGTTHTLSKLRERFWIVKARSLINSVIHSCLACRAWEGGAYQLPSMPSLPIARVTEASAFLHVGIDYFGPLTIVEGQDLVKVYVCLFVCLVTRAVHLEAARDLSGSEFLLCLDRFCSRRGVPLIIISDNATNFTFIQPLVGIKVEVLDSHVDTYLNSNRICWKFIPAYAPWQGGAYERLVGLVKRSLKKSYGFQRLDLIQFINALCRIENIVNSRPLTYVSSNEVLEPLTPNHFLRLRQINVLEQLEVSSAPLRSERPELLHAYNSIPQVLDSFWEIFRNQYLTSLRERHVAGHRPVKGSLPFVPNCRDIVLISSPCVPRSLWSPGVIRRVDKRGGEATVETAAGKLVIRSICHLYPLELPTAETHVKIPKASRDLIPTVPPIAPTKRSRRKRRKSN